MTENKLPYELPTEVRDFAEKSVEQARKAFDGFLGAANKAVAAAETQSSTMQANSKEMATKAISFAEQNISAAFDLAQKIVRAKDVQEILQHQADYMRAQVSAMQSQVQDFGQSVQASVQKASEEAQATFKKAAADVEKATSDLTKKK